MSTNVFEVPDVSQHSYTQAVRVQGSAGDSKLVEDGTSFAEAALYNLFTFDFGHTSSDFTVILTASNSQTLWPLDQPTTIRSQGTGERLFDAGLGFQAFLLTPEGNIIGPALGLEVGSSTTVTDLTGIHTFRLGIMRRQA